MKKEIKDKVKKKRAVRRVRSSNLCLVAKHVFSNEFILLVFAKQVHVGSSGVQMSSKT